MPNRWRLGDNVYRPVFGPREELLYGQRWHPAVVESIRRDGMVVVRSYGHLYEHSQHELKPRDAFHA